MLKKAAAVGGVALGGGVLLGVGGATRFGMPVETWRFVWPGLVALLFLVLALTVFLVGWRRSSTPLWVAFVAQTIGALVLLNEGIDHAWETLKWTGISVGVALVLIAITWVLLVARSRWLERRMVEGFGGTDDIDPEQLEQIRENMLDALAMLRRAGHGRSAVYELPWFLVMGRPSAGKTEAIKRSGLSLPVRKDWVKGVGGTHTSDYFFTNEMIFVDTPGKWVQEGASEDLKGYWQTLTRLLRKFRGRRPLDGLIVVVPADDLMTKDSRHLADQAANVREVIDLIQDDLRFRFPVYVLVSKSDLVEGFADFFWGIPAQRRDEILGWSNPDPNNLDVSDLVDRGLSQLQKRFRRYRLEMLTKSGRKSRNRRLFFFAEEMSEIREPLTAFAEELFHEDPRTQTPIFRGFYFTSAMQGEGTPVSRAMSELSRHLNLPVTGPAPAKPEESRAFFLLEVLRDLMVGDEGLIARTRFHWLKQRRKTAFGTFLPAGLAVLLLLLSGVSLMLNRGLYRDIEREVPKLVETLDEQIDAPLTYESLKQRLAQTDRLRRYHRSLTTSLTVRRFGMRRAADLTEQVYKVYRKQLSRAVLNPTFTSAQGLVAGQSPFCHERVGVFHSVVWLREESRFEGSGSIEELVLRAWNVPDDDHRAELARELRGQFGYLKRHAPENYGGSLLEGFDLTQAAEDLRDQCGQLGEQNSLTLFATFQKDCLVDEYPWELVSGCRDTLQQISKWSEQQGSLYLERRRELQEDLLKTKERGADRALEILGEMIETPAFDSACVDDFNDKILPLIDEYIPDDATVSECRTRRRKDGSPRGYAAEWYDGTGDVRKNLGAQMQVFNSDADCRNTLSGIRVDNLDVTAIDQFGYQFLREACARDAFEPTETTPTTSTTVATSRPVPRPRREAAVKKVSSQIFAQACRPVKGYTAPSWEYRSSAWLADWQDADPTNDRPLTAAQRNKLRGGVSSGIREFSGNFGKKWRECLSGIRWRDDLQADLAGWMRAAVESGELAPTLRAPAQEANAILGMMNEEPFSAGQPQLQAALTSFQRLADAVPDYEASLGRVATELERIAGDDQAFIDFQRSFEQRDFGNPLVALRLWLDNNSGAADGSVRELLYAPYRAAEEFIRGEDRTKAIWGQIQRDWNQGIAGKFPFDPDPALELVDPDVLVAILGDSGSVKSLPAGIQLGAEAQAWLDRVQSLKEQLVDGDAIAPLELLIEAPDAVENVDEIPTKYRVRSVSAEIGGSKFPWSAETGRDSMSVEVDLFSLAASKALVEAVVGEKKGKLGSAIGKNWKDDTTVAVVEIEGPWAALRILAERMPPELGGSGSVPVAFDVPWSWKKEDSGAFRVTYEVSGPQLPELVRLVRDGFPPPPAFDE